MNCLLMLGPRSEAPHHTLLFPFCFIIIIYYFACLLGVISLNNLLHNAEAIKLAPKWIVFQICDSLFLQLKALEFCGSASHSELPFLGSERCRLRLTKWKQNQPDNLNFKMKSIGPEPWYPGKGTCLAKDPPEFYFQHPKSGGFPEYRVGRSDLGTSLVQPQNRTKK